MPPRKSRIHLSAFTLLLLLSCMAVSHADNPVGSDQIIRMATTTSTENSGLLRALLPAFKQQTGYEVHVIAVGTGKALRMGRDGDVDVVLVHAPRAEEQFVHEGYGLKRHPVMYNDFVLVGPKSDPAQVMNDKDIEQALKKIAHKQATFISRGDDSGTHKKEKSLWQASNIKPRGSWYREAGQGMGKVLQIASELDAYTLTDRGTWFAYREKSPLVILSQGDKRLHNPYGIIAVSPARYPDTNHAGAESLIHWITSPAGQQRIGNFTLSGDHLFTPSAVTSFARTPGEKTP